MNAKEFRGLLLNLLGKLKLVAAVFLLAVLAAVAALYATGALNRQNARAAWDVLSGGRVAMTTAQRDRLDELEAQARARGTMEQREQEASGQARQDVEKRREQLAAEYKREHEFLKLLSDQLLADRRKLGEESRQLADAKDKLAQAQKTFQQEKDETHLRKVLKLYAGIDAETIARDFEDKLKDEKARKEVVEILRRMPERQASEVLSAIEKSDVRNKLLEELRKS